MTARRTMSIILATTAILVRLVAHHSDNASSSGSPADYVTIVRGPQTAAIETVGHAVTLRFAITNFGPTMPHLALDFDDLSRWRVVAVASDGPSQPQFFAGGSNGDSRGGGWDIGALTALQTCHLVVTLLPIEAGHPRVTITAYGDYVGGDNVPIQGIMPPLLWNVTIKPAPSHSGAPRIVSVDVGRPQGIVVDSAGNLYVADSRDDVVRKIAPSGHVLTTFGTHMPRNDALNQITALALDTHANVYVADAGNHRIVVFSPDGHLRAAWAQPRTAPGYLHFPSGITVDRHTDVYVSDGDIASYYARILQFSADGRLLARWGSYGTAPGQFDEPAGLAIDGHGHLYVADTQNDRIQELSPRGQPLATWTAADLSLPAAVALDQRGSIVAVGGQDLIRLAAPGHEVLKRTLPGSTDTGAEALFAQGIALDDRGHIYVADTDNGRVVEFSHNGHLLAIYE